MPQVGEGNSVAKAVFDSSLGKHGGTRYRGSGGQFTPNPNKGKPWYCQKSPTGAHYWVISAHQGVCKYCQAVQELSTSAPSAYPTRSRGV